MRASRDRGSPKHHTEAASEWESFTNRLETSLSALPRHSIAVVSAKRGWCYVQFAIGPFAVSAEAMSNQYIEPPKYKLTSHDMQILRELGWQSPALPPPELYDGQASGGSPNYWQDFLVPIDYQHVANTATDTLRRAYHIPYPSDLTYRTFPMRKT